MVIDLNTIEDGEEEPVEQGLVCLELWHACAGMRISLPGKGSLVVYLPQGHMEHLFVDGGEGDLLLPFRLPPHVLCRVVDVQLRAEAVTDDVYAQLSLVAEGEVQERGAEGDGEEMDDVDSRSKSSVPHMFCKTLTASDTSSHGGFSVPRRAAEDCFPPLDYNQLRPSQELVAKDLHGLEWHFRHIYRGQPRRHLLTTGWSAFINKKKLVSGDAVLFIRGDDGQLRLGVRRASQFKENFCRKMPPSQSLNVVIDTLQSLENSFTTKNNFQINYYPRVNPAEFIVPYWKFTKSCSYSISAGTRFKMRFEGEDAAERRCTGLVTAVSDFDPERWPGSKWRSIVVRWDDDNVVDCSQHSRVSPWEMEPTGSSSAPHNLLMSSSKRSRVSNPSTIPDYPPHGESGFQRLGESVKSRKVLQGQEILSFKAPFNGGDTALPRISETRNPCLSERGCISTRVWPGNSDFFFKDLDMKESLLFHQVLQGQEMVPVTPPACQMDSESRFENGGFKTSKSGIAGRRPPSSLLMFQQPAAQLPYFNYINETNEKEKSEDLNLFSPFYYSSCPKQSSTYLPEYFEFGSSLTQPTEKSSQRIVHDSNSGCRLFGFPLARKLPVMNMVSRSLNEAPSLMVSNIEPSFSRLRPQMAPKPGGHACTRLGASIGHFFQESTSLIPPATL